MNGRDQVAAWLRQLLATAQPGWRLPSQQALARTHGVSRETVKRALEQLTREGLIVTRRGAGTYAATPPRDVVSFVGEPAPRDPLEELSAAVVAISRWVDEYPPNAARDPQARTWGRLAKVGEEAGEVTAAYIAATGQNPRKGIHGAMADVGRELLDVAVTALAAYEHVTGHAGGSAAALLEHARLLCDRAGVRPVAAD